MGGQWSSTRKPETRLKVVVVGPPNVGKTALVNHWAGLPVPDHYQATQGVRECEVRRDFMRERNACLVLRDVGSHVVQDNYRAAGVLRDADAVVLVYSCRRLQEDIAKLMQTWMRLLIYWVPPVATILLSVGDRRAVTDNFARELAPEEGEMFDAVPGPTKEVVHCFQGGQLAVEDAALETVFRLAFSSAV